MSPDLNNRPTPEDTARRRKAVVMETARAMIQTALTEGIVSMAIPMHEYIISRQRGVGTTVINTETGEAEIITEGQE